MEERDGLDYNTMIREYTDRYLGRYDYQTKSIMKTVSQEDIELPETFKKVIMKIHPEIKDVVTDGFNHQKRYNPNNFEPETYFEVELKIYFHQDQTPKGTKDFYKDSFADLFNMTYGIEMGFVSFKVSSLVVPPAKTNDEKFMELFGKNHAKNN